MPPQTRPRVAVLTAMTNELRPVVKAMSLHGATTAGGMTHAGTIGGADIVAGITGVGTALATEVAERVLNEAGVDHVVMVGIAGGIDDSMAIGRVVVPEVVVDRASGNEYRPVALAGTTSAGGLATGDDLLLDPAKLSELRQRGIVAMDMETAAVGAACERHGVPWSAFRSISDRPSDGLFDESVMAMLKPDGSPDLGGVIKHLARRPQSIGKLVRLGREAGIATRAAAQAAATACASQWG